MKRIKRVLALILCGAMLVGNLPTPVFAEDLFQQGLCEHHLVHDNCGYQEAIIGADCSHEHTEECYTQAHSCVHQHGDCSYVESSDEITCDHQCTAENGCISIQLACCHSHDDQCGYAEPQESSPCTYVCEECIQQDSPVCTGALDCSVNEHDDGCEKKAAEEKATADQAVADPVAALIAELPALEQLQTMPLEEQTAWYNQIQYIYSVYEQLTDDQKASLPPAKEVFKPYFDYFNSQTEELILEGICGDNLTWVLDDAGTLTISGSGEMYSYRVSYNPAPWYSYRLQIRSVVIAAGATSIGWHAFYGCSNLTSIIIPKSVTSIGHYAFYDCSSLTDVYIDDVAAWLRISFGTSFANPIGVSTSLTKKLYVKGSLLTNLVIPAGVTSIGSEMFSGCDSLISVTIPNGVTSIGSEAFSYCVNLATVTIQDAAAYIGESAFRGCSSLRDVTLGKNVTGIGKSAFYLCTSLERIAIPDGVTQIESYVFGSCLNLKSVAIPLSVKKINTYAFSYCETMHHVYYGGTAEQWNAIEMGDNGCLTNAKLHCGVNGMKLEPYVTTTCTSKTLFKCDVCGEILYDNSYEGSHRYVNGNCSVCGVSQDLVYTICDGQATIKDYTGSAKSLVIPASVEGYPVTQIGHSAFYNCSTLKSVTIPDSVTHIWGEAFYGCTSLESIIFPDSVNYLAYSVLENCSNLKHVRFPARITSIPSGMFINCTSLETLVIPDSVTKVGTAFIGCSCLKSITLGSQVTSIDESAFRDCSSLSEIYVADLATWLNIDFRNDAANPLSVNSNPKKLYADGELVTDLVIPAGITEIKPYAFVGYSGLTSVNIPAHVTDIGGCAFSGCSNLKSVTCENVAPSMGGYIFENCSNLTYVQLPEGITSIPAYMFYKCDSLLTIAIPSSVTSIGDAAFLGCGNLLGISIPAGLEYIGRRAFINTQIDHIFYAGTEQQWQENIGNNIKSAIYHFEADGLNVTPIGNTTPPRYRCDICSRYLYDRTTHGTHTYENGYCTVCGKIAYLDYTVSNNEVTITGYTGTAEELVIPAILDACPVTAIGSGAFRDCDSLKTITVPDSVASIGSSAFSGCTSLESINIPSGVTEIEEYAFAYCEALTGITIPDAVTSIGDSAFSGCTSLKGINIPSGVTEIEEYTFAYCEALTGITIPDAVTSIGDSAFCGCGSLKSINIPYGVSEIGEDAFWNCKALTSITIPDNVTGIGDYAFCRSGLTDIVLPASLTAIKAGLFSNCTSLKTITFNADAPEIASDAFKNVTATARFPAGNATWTAEVKQDYGGKINWEAYYVSTGTCGENLTWNYNISNETLTISGNGAIHDFAASGDAPWSLFSHEIKKVIIAEGVTSIGSNAFYGFSNLSGVTIPDSVTSIGAHAFENCCNMRSITIPAHVASIDPIAFLCCENLTDVYYGGTTEQWLDLAHCINAAFIHCDCVDSVGHWFKNSVTVTCTMDGYIYDACACGYERNKVFTAAAQGHREVIDKAVAPTCTTTGLSEGKHCSVCDEVLTAQQIVPANDHTEVVDNAVAPTCTVTGLSEGKHCSVCDEVLTAQQIVPANGHTEVIDKGVAPTCTTTGLSEGKHCSACGEVLKAQTIVRPTGHHFEDGMCKDCDLTEPDKGDVDGDGSIDAQDAAQLLWYTLFPNLCPDGCEADFNNDGNMDEKDAEYLIWHTLFPTIYPLQ